MMNCFPNIYLPFFLTNKPRFVESSNVPSKKTTLLSFPCDRDSHVTVFWPLWYKQLLDGASGKLFIRGMTQQVGLFCPSSHFLLLTWNTDIMMARAVAAILWPWDQTRHILRMTEKSRGILGYWWYQSCCTIPEPPTFQLHFMGENFMPCLV